jgi:hypothetical protein
MGLSVFVSSFAALAARVFLEEGRREEKKDIKEGR